MRFRGIGNANLSKYVTRGMQLEYGRGWFCAGSGMPCQSPPSRKWDLLLPEFRQNPYG